jgi:hypothetical protein
MCANDNKQVSFGLKSCLLRFTFGGHLLAFLEGSKWGFSMTALVMYLLMVWWGELGTVLKLASHFGHIQVDHSNQCTMVKK